MDGPAPVPKRADTLNAFIARSEAGAPKEIGDGPLAGLTLAAKDNIESRDFATTAGTPALAANRPARNAPAVQRLLDAGAALLGKTNMHELAFGITSRNAHFGAVVNPYDAAVIAGGSSGGSAAAVAAGLVDLALGTDTGGSMRIPAALCGVVGFRPTMGRYPADGVIQISHTRDTIGPMARTVERVALMDSVITGEVATFAPTDPASLRIGVPQAPFWEDLHPDVEVIAEEALERLRSRGATLIEADLASTGEAGMPIAALNDAVGFPIVFYECQRDLARYLAEADIGVDFQSLRDQIASADVIAVFDDMLGDGEVSTEAYLRALLTHRAELQAAYADYFSAQDVQAMIYPTTPLPARPENANGTVCHNGRDEPVFPLYIRNTDPASNAGIPAISVPAGLTADGLPVGIELAGPVASDRALLGIAGALQQAVGPIDPPPGVGG